MQFVDSLQWHLDHPEISVQQYIGARSLELGQWLSMRKAVYLDTKFWIDLRDVRLGISKNEHYQKLLLRLTELARNQKIVCPISVDTYLEVFKQTFPSTLKETIKLIDELSFSICLVEPRERFQAEVHHFIRETTKGTSAVHSLRELVWTKVPYVLGFVTPHAKSFPLEHQIAIEKAFVDQMWVVTLSDMLEIAGADRNGRKTYPDDFAEKVNQEKLARTHEYSSFKQLFLNELAGILDVERKRLASLMRRIYEKDTGNSVAMSEADEVDAGRGLSNLIFNAFRLNKIKAQLPSFRITAGLHAAIRWDTHRKYKLNDFHDIHHAVAAIPYCDYFFTERSLRALVTSKNLELNTYFECQVFSEPMDALTALSTL